MTYKKQNGGPDLTSNSDLIQPGDGNEVGSDGIINTTGTEEAPVAEPIPFDMEGASYTPSTGVQLKNVNYAEYAKYIDRPFSFISDDPDDLRAYGQSTGEKWAYALPKLVTRVGTNVLGSTVGLVYGGGAFLGGLFDGPEGDNATKSFFDNDFQRSMDGINDWMDGALPHYYTKEEQDYNFFQSMGTANFWANDFSQGLSFVVGAVLSEVLTRGAATSSLAARAGQLFHKAGKASGLSKGKAYLGAGATSKGAGKAADDILNAKRWSNARTTLRQLGTGAMYESGVEARHHYDQTMTNLTGAFLEEYGRQPGDEEMGHLVDIATKSANSVFAGNVALVGYGNYMMFPRIFGKGFNATKNSFKKQISNSVKGKARDYKALYKSVGKGRGFTRQAWRVLKAPLYEGFVEEGGQKLLDLSGQEAAENWYHSKKDPSALGMATELVSNIGGSMGDVYGSKEGQKEIGIGFLLAAIGLPGMGVKTDSKGDAVVDKLTGKTKTGFKWQGGMYGSIKDGQFEKKMLDQLVTDLKENSDAVTSLNLYRDRMVRGGVNLDQADLSQIIDSPYMGKNTKDDNIFNYISSRLKSGFEQEVLDDIETIRNMSVEEFRQNFAWDELQDLNDAELRNKQTEMADLMEARTAEIKTTSNKVNRTFVNYDEDVKDAIVHALATSKNLDAREDSMIQAIEEIIGSTLEGEMDVESRLERDKREDIGVRARVSRLWGRLTKKQKSKILALPEAKAYMKMVGIKEFTDPTHMEELVLNLITRRKELEEEITALEEDDSVTPKPAVFDKDGHNIGGTEAEQVKWAKLRTLGDEFDSIDKKTTELLEAINEGLDPDLSASEQALLDKWKNDDLGSHTENIKNVTTMMKDLRKVRARRHRKIDMVNELMDYHENEAAFGLGSQEHRGKKVPKPRMLRPEMLHDPATDNAEDIKDLRLKRLFVKYQGKVIEFDYTRINKDTKEGLLARAKEAGIEEKVIKDALALREKDSELSEIDSLKTALTTAGVKIETGPKTGTYRFYVRPGKPTSDQDNFLITYPTQENVELILELRALEKLEGNREASKRIEEINELLKANGFTTEYQERNLSFLLQAENLREISAGAQVQEIIDIATIEARQELENQIAAEDQRLKNAVEAAEKLAEDLVKANSSRVSERRKKDLAEKVKNLAVELAAIEQAISSIEVNKAVLVEKLNNVNKLIEVVLGAESREDVAERIKEHLKTQWNTLAETLEKFVGDGFFKDVELLSEMFTTEEDVDKLNKLAQAVYHFASTMDELPLELVRLLDAGVADLKTKYEEALPVLESLRSMLHFKADGSYDARFKSATEEQNRATYEAMVNNVDAMLLGYNTAVEKLRTELQMELSPVFEEVQKQTTLQGKIVAANNILIDQFNTVTTIIDDILTPEASTIPDEREKGKYEDNNKEAEMDDEEFEKSIDNQKGTKPTVYYNSPAIIHTGMGKTAGSHAVASAKREELQLLATQRELKPFEQAQLQAYINQEVFFEWTAKTNKNDLRNHHKLVVLTRQNIIDFDNQLANADNKVGADVLFYNHPGAKRAKGDPRYSAATDKEGKPTKFGTNELRDESQEDLVLLVVDAFGVPVRVNGRVIYTSMMGSEAYKPQADLQGKTHQVYRYGRADLKKVKGTVPGFKVDGKYFFTGEMSEESKAVLEQHVEFRRKLLAQSEGNTYISISGKSHGMQIYPGLNYNHKGFAGTTLVKREEDVKNIDLRISSNNETNKVSIHGKVYTVRAGFLYAVKDDNLVRFKMNTLPPQIASNVYHLLKLLATQVENSKTENADFTPTSALFPPNYDKSIIKQLTELIYFGKHSAGRENSAFSIFTKGDTLYFGDQSITFAQLASEETYPVMHEELRTFIANLHVQVNNLALKADEEVRNTGRTDITTEDSSPALKAIRKKIIKARKKHPRKSETEIRSKLAGLTKAQKALLNKQDANPNYKQYTEVVVGADLTVTTRVWDNYTHFLMGKKALNETSSRSIHEVPVTVNMEEDVSSASRDNLSYEVPQFMNIYLTWNSKVKTTPLSDMGDPTSKPRLKSSPVKADILDDETDEETTVDDEQVEGLAPSGVMEGQTYRYVQGESGVEIILTINHVDHENGLTHFDLESITGPEGNSIALERVTDEMSAELMLAIYASRGKVDEDGVVGYMVYDTTEQKLEDLGKETEDEAKKDEKDLKKNDIEELPEEDEEEDDDTLGSSRVALISDDYQRMNFEEEYAKFLEMVPKDKHGNPIFDVEIVRRLVNGTDWGFFSKTEKILLSADAAAGTLYHETFHGITLKLLSPEERAELYNEVRGLKGKATTYKGAVKDLKDFTDLEADEWLAEEFREYVQADGNYTVGDNIEKSWIQKLFSFLFKFLNSAKQSQDLFHRIHTGYYNNAIEDYTVYSVEEALNGRAGAASRAKKSTTGVQRDLSSGMTVALFDVMSKTDTIKIEDLFGIKNDPKALGKKLGKLYGIPGSKGTVYSIVRSSIVQDKKALREKTNAMIQTWRAAGKPASMAKSILQLKTDYQKLEEVLTVLETEWGSLIVKNIEYLQQFKLDANTRSLEEVLNQELEENGMSRDTLGIRAANTIDQRTLVSPGVKLLLGTLPQTISDMDGQSLFKKNRSGTYQLATFSQVINTLYKNLANVHNVEDMVDVLQELAQENKTYAFLLDRLGIRQGIESVEHLNDNQMYMLMGFLNTFNVASEEYVTLMANQTSYETNPGRYFTNSNTDRAENILKRSWNSIFKDNIRGGLGKTIEGGRRILDINKKGSIGIPSGSGLMQHKSFKQWTQTNLTFPQLLALLDVIGINYSNKSRIIEMQENGRLEGFEAVAGWVFKEIIESEGDVSSLFGREVEGNLKTLLGYEIDTTDLAITLQHVNPMNKVVFGITRKSYINILADKLNSTEEEAEALLKESPWMRGSLYLSEPVMNIRTIEGGKDIHRGVGHDISRTTKANIALEHVASILEGFVPLIRTGNKKMEKALQIGHNKHRSLPEMRKYLQDLLLGEILMANLIANNKEIQQIPELKKNGQKLQFFGDPVAFPRIQKLALFHIGNGKLSETDPKLLDAVYGKDAQIEILAFLAKKEKEALDLLTKYGFISKGAKGGYNNIGIDNIHIDEAYESLSEKERSAAFTDNGRISSAVMNRVATKLANNQLIGIVEQHRLFLGSPALYKDVFKRTSGMVGVKKYPTYTQGILEWMNNNMPNMGTKKDHTSTVRFVTRKEHVIGKSPYLDKYINRLVELGREDLVDSVSKAYSNMEIFDGGGLVTFDFYRSTLFLTDNWSDKQEQAYRKIIAGEQVHPSELALFPPLKPQVFAPSVVGGMRVNIFNKFALYPVHPNLSKTVSQQGQDTSMDDLYYDMVNNNLDYMVFESGTKVGAKTNAKGQFEPAFNTETGEYIPLSADRSYQQEFDLEYFGVQLDPTLKNKTNVRVGTQSASMALMNVFVDGVLNTENYGPEFKALDEQFHAIHSAMIEKDKASLAAKLGFIRTQEGYEAIPGKSKPSMKNALLEELSKRENPEHMKDTVEELFAGDLSYTNSLANKQKLDDLLYSIVTNAVIARKINGTMAVLQPDVGFTLKARKQDTVDLPGYRTLRFYDFEKDGKTVTAMEVYLPHYMRKQFGEGEVRIEDLTDAARELVGFRIPTEGLNSVEFIKVADFLPESMGATVVVPHEMVAKSGADYDIDKLTIYLPNVSRTVLEDGTSKIGLVSRIDNPLELLDRDVNAFRAAAAELFGTDSNSLRDFLLDITAYRDEINPSEKVVMGIELSTTMVQMGWDNLSDVMQQPSDVVQNMLLENMKNILKHPASFPQLIAPVGAFELKDIAHEIHNAQVAAGIKGVEAEATALFDIFSMDNLITTTYQMHQTLGGTGIIATNMSDLGKSQRAGFGFNQAGEEVDRFGDPMDTTVYNLNFEGLQNETISLSRVKDVNGNYINRSMQQYITAYVDGEKDPFAMYVNAGQSGAAVHVMLIRAGVPLETVLKFMSQPVIQEYYRLKNMQSIASTTSDYAESYSETDVQDQIRKLVGESEGTAALNEMALDRHEESRSGKMVRASDSMLVTNLKDMGKGQKGLQAQIFSDFLRYKEYADLLRKAQKLSSFDTDKIGSGYDLIHLAALGNIVNRKNAFYGLSNKTSRVFGLGQLGSEEGIDKSAPFVSKLQDMYTTAPDYFTQTDLKEAMSTDINGKSINPLKSAMVEMAEDLISEGKSKDEIIYVLRAFDNFVTSWVWQSHQRTDLTKLNESLSEYFQGDNSLPARVLKAKDTFPDNALIQDLISSLQEFTDPTDFDHTIDMMQLFSRKYAPSEIDDLADAWYELSNSGPTGKRLADDIVLFSMMKSGTGFHPTSFFHALPGVEVLDATAPMLKAVHDAISVGGITASVIQDIKIDFLDNSWDNPRITRHKYSNKSMYKSDEVIYTKEFNDDRVTIKSLRQRGAAKGIASNSNEKYFTVHLEYVGTSEDGYYVYKRRAKKGIMGHLIEVNTDKSIIESNNHPFGRQRLHLTTKIIKQLHESKRDMLHFAYDVNDPKRVKAGTKILPNGTVIHLEHISTSSLRELLNKDEYRIFGVKDETALKASIAKRSGYKNWAAFSKDKYNTSFINGRVKRSFFAVETLETQKLIPSQPKELAPETVSSTLDLQSLRKANNENECE